MSVHAYKRSAAVHRGVLLSCVAAGAVGIAAGVYLLITHGERPGLFTLIIGTPILVGLAAAVATLVVTPLMARDLKRQLDAEEELQRALLGAEALITNAVARYFHPVPAQHVPLGPGEITAYTSGYLVFEAADGGYYRSRQLDGWRQQAEDEIVLECSPLYEMTVHTRHAPEWRAWLAQFHGPGAADLVIDLAEQEQRASAPDAEAVADS
jgi:hypothetical protein